MKAKLLSFCLLAVALLLGSCIFQKGKLAIEVADANNDCPCLLYTSDAADE